MKKKFKFILMGLLISFNALSQQRIAGIILDSLTNEPVPGVSIVEQNAKAYSISNEDGEFEILVSNSSSTIVFSHVSYNKKQIKVGSDEYINIKLSLAIIQLPEVRSGNPAIHLLNAVVNKALLDTNQRTFHKAFYQRVSEQNGKYTKLQEMFMNVSWSQFGVEKWQPLNARFAQIDAQGYKNPNISILSFLNSGVIHKQNNFPLNNISISEIYNYKIKQYINFGKEEEVAVIACTPKSKESNVFQFVGDIFVATHTDNLVRISGKIIYPETKMGSRVLTLTVNFKVNNTGYSVFDNLYLIQNVGKKTFSKGDSEKIWFFFQEEINEFSAEKIYPAFVRDDLKVFKESKYNAEFWEDSVPIKHTKLEQDVIKYFERQKQFTSNF